MAGEPENLVLNYLRGLRDELSGNRDAIGDLKFRLLRQELEIAGLIKDRAHYEGKFAEVDAMLDQIRNRLGIIDGKD